MQNKNINFKWIEDLNVKNNTTKICVKYFWGGQRESVHMQVVVDRGTGRERILSKVHAQHAAEGWV